MPLISIIIPVYNGEKTIRETINSVLNQTFTDFEVIVINDGSTDRTLDILRVVTIQEPRVNIFSYPRSGSYPSRNHGIEHARGDFIAFLDADDLWTADKLEAQLKALQTNPNAAVAYSWTDFIDEFGQPLDSGVQITKNGDVLVDLLQSNFIVSGSNPLVRKQALDDVGMFDESFVSGGDWDLWLRLAERYHFVAVPVPQVLYRRTNDSLSANLSRLEAGGRKVFEHAFQRVPDSLQHLKKFGVANFYRYLTYRALKVFPGSPECLPGRQKALAAIRFLWLAVKNDPKYLLEWRFISGSLFDITTVLTLPPQQAQRLRNRMYALVNR